MASTLNPVLTVTPSDPPTHNFGICETFSYIPVAGAGRPLYAKATYITNFSDLSISLSAGELNIGSVTIKDQNSGINCDVVTDPDNGLNALRVFTQDLESVYDDVTIGDKEGKNFATINNTFSALNVFNVNPVTAVEVSGNVTITNPVTAMVDTSKGFPVTLAPSTNFDAFSRLRVSEPVTLFDSSHRYQDNGLWSSLSAVGGIYSFNSNQGLMDLTVNTLSGSSVIRETTKVFSYQPGKGLLTMNTFVMAPSSNNLRQRVGYFGKNNGFYFQLNDNQISFVKRTSVNGSVVEIIKDKSEWNGDKLDGAGLSGFTLDITKAQILWMDFEWLGVGTVRMGFVINGQFIICHSFHHANIEPTTYITTACLPVRYEITNKGSTNVSHTLKQICSTVISEGGYELRGAQYAATIPIGTPRDLTNLGTFYPIISLRLKSTREDAIAILSALSLLGITNNANYNWKIIGKTITSGGTWIPAENGSSVEYNLTATSFSEGKTLASGFTVGSNQGPVPVNLSKEDLFKFQLERDSLSNVYYEIVLAVASDTAGADVYASMDWEEVSR